VVRIYWFADDYIKVFRKNKEGLSARMKLAGQIFLGLVVGAVMYFHPDVVIKEKNSRPQDYVKPNKFLRLIMRLKHQLFFRIVRRTFYQNHHSICKK
jgi:UDP-N-acetylmuramyl pentapeptide phosphotransferase/UDP-N-acetylglucosamine-1-phosphate transferase